MILLLVPALFLLAGQAGADTPANCTYEDVEGSWIFYESERSQDSSIDCMSQVPVVAKFRINLKYPNVAVDQFGNVGTWTMVYNQGFEVTVSGRSYFAYSDYGQVGQDSVVSYCNQTQSGHGWSHDVTVRNWACFTGKKIEENGAKYKPKYHKTSSSLINAATQLYTQAEEDAETINTRQSSWQATVYPSMQNVSVRDIYNMRGGIRSVLHAKPQPKKQGPFSEKLKVKSKSFLPSSWDWREVSGGNYVSEVRNQGACGSCYAFSSIGMLEARVKIATKNTKNYVFSPQDVVSCSPLAQGCEGGFPYLVAGRYAKDYGVVEESCSPYQGQDGACSTKKCLKHYVASYSYVGGYYGGCSEEAMKKALVENGPVSVSFEVYNDFMMYKSGVYHHTGLVETEDFEPFEETNHAVLLVGYGHDSELGEDYWTIKNSWGPGWGEDGFFRIRRGVDECAIESIAVEAVPIP